MRPIIHPSATARLISLQFESTPCEDGQPITYRSGPPIAVEDGAFMSWWKPSWPERIRLLCGVPVRVKVNYSLHGPLHLDTESTWGAPSSPDWSDSAITSLARK
jgi:hypothetical protein